MAKKNATREQAQIGSILSEDPLPLFRPYHEASIEDRWSLDSHEDKRGGW